MGLGKRLIATDAAGGVVATDNFQTITYTGNGGTQSTNSLSNQSGTVNFQPDLVWIKERSGTQWNSLYDSIRGVGNRIVSNSPNAENFYAPRLTSFNSNGFSIGSDGDTNTLNDTYVAWCWKAPTSETNTSGTITSTIKKNVDAGFSIVETTSPSSTINFNYGHGLSKAPELVIVKTLNIASYWEVIFPDTFGSATGSSSPSDWNRIKLNESDPVMSSNAYLAADGTKIYNGAWQANTELINYCFHSVSGYQKVGGYQGNGGTNAISLGFQPRFLLLKNRDANVAWVIMDSVRGFDPTKWLHPNEVDAEYTDGTSYITVTASGFTMKTNDVYTNKSGDDYIYLAIA